jgi:hypothetical protein
MSAELKKTKKLVKMLEGQGAIVVPYVGNVRQKNAFPDRLIYHSMIGVPIAVEFKDYDTKLRSDQQALIARLNRLTPGHAFVWRFEGLALPHVLDYYVYDRNMMTLTVTRRVTHDALTATLFVDMINALRKEIQDGPV